MGTKRGRPGRGKEDRIKPPTADTSSAAGHASRQDSETALDGTPPVDLLLIEALLRRELPESEARRVYGWVYTNPAWEEAHNRLLLERLRSGASGQ
jgi:hypothetical protein